MNIFFTTLEKIYSSVAANSLSPLVFPASCCGTEIVSAIASDNGEVNFGTEVFGANPRHADLLIVAGTITHKSAPVLLTLYEQMPNPKYVIAIGACACSGGMFANDSYSVINGADKIIPVDVYLPMCPPAPEAFTDALNKLREKIKTETDSGKNNNSPNVNLTFPKNRDILVYDRKSGK